PSAPRQSRSVASPIPGNPERLLIAAGRDYLKVLSGALAKADLWVGLVDGTHEDYKALLQLSASCGPHGGIGGPGKGAAS
ncbi:MAG: hypothetical protein ACYDEA_04120, partial [Candidatus Dormibacteria bacterium]